MMGVDSQNPYYVPYPCPDPICKLIVLYMKNLILYQSLYDQEG